MKEATDHTDEADVDRTGVSPAAGLLPLAGGDGVDNWVGARVILGCRKAKEKRSPRQGFMPPTAGFGEARAGACSGARIGHRRLQRGRTTGA
jgi:hypothetical protein